MHLLMVLANLPNLQFRLILLPNIFLIDFIQLYLYLFKDVYANMPSGEKSPSILLVLDATRNLYFEGK